MTALAVGCTSGDAEPDGSGESTAAAVPDPEFVRGADRICTTTRKDLADLGANAQLDASDPDPVREGLIRPGALIFARQAEQFRELADRIVPTEEIRTYTGYFEIIDTLLNARLRVGEPGGPVETAAHSLEARFQAMSVEQAEAAVAAGLPGCAFDVNDTIFGS